GSDALPRRPISITPRPRSPPRMPDWPQNRRFPPLPPLHWPRLEFMPKMTFVERDGNRKEVEVPAGYSLLEIAHKFGVDIEGACEGSLACSTCHVIVDPAWTSKLAEATEDEEDMLDLAFGLTDTSRLGCQIVMTDTLDVLVVKLPAGTRNLLNE